MKRKLKKWKRRMRKRIYNTLLFLSEYDFRKLIPAVAGLCFVALFIVACMLPTTTRTNEISAEVSCGSSLAGDIRSTVRDYSTLEHQPDVIAVFLPAGFETMTENELLACMEGRTLYSFYINSKELSYLAESAVVSGSNSSVLYLDGLDYTYHENRFPFDRVTSLAFSNGTAISSDKETLYHIIATEEIFALFHYGSYRSLGLMEISPKNSLGIQLSDYQEAIVSKQNASLTVASAIAYAAMHPESNITEVPSVVTTLGGYNLISLWSAPNKVTILICAMFFFMIVLLWFALPRLHRIMIWTRIYTIRRRKRSRRVRYGKRPLSRSELFYQIGR